MPNNHLRKLVIIAIVFVIAAIGFGVFFFQKSYTTPTSSPAIVDSYRLQEVLPEKIANYVTDRVEQWSSVNNHDKSPGYHITEDGIYTNDDGYVFSLQKGSKDESVVVSVKVQDIGNFYSTTVRINGELQSIN